MTSSEFRALFQSVSNWGRWEDRPQRGALNHITPERIAAAARLARRGVTVTVGQPLYTEAGADRPTPAVHRMTMLPEAEAESESGGVGFAKDYVGVDFHNEGHSHIDALSHVAFDKLLFDGKPDSSITSRGAQYGTIEALADGLIGRGVLLDLPRRRGVRWLEPGYDVMPDDLEAAAADQGVSVGAGDILLVRTGHARRLAELAPADAGEAQAGLHPSVATFLAQRSVAALGSETNHETSPSTTEGIAFPIHVLAINAMGVYLLDYLQFEDLVPHCEAAQCWEFLFVGAPLRIAGGTGSPLNPVAVL